MEDKKELKPEELENITGGRILPVTPVIVKTEEPEPIRKPVLKPLVNIPVPGAEKK